MIVLAIGVTVAGGAYLMWTAITKPPGSFTLALVGVAVCALLVWGAWWHG